MGEAKCRREATEPMVYHHTSTLRTNLIWMSGVIEIEGKSEGVFHPKFGEIHTTALARRSLVDFPPLVWFTTRIDVPKCLSAAELRGVNKSTGETIAIDGSGGMANAMALNRMAIGFRIADISVVRWPDHYGYDTAEGEGLNASARDWGDDPDNWYVAEGPVDVALVAEMWISRSIMKPKLQRVDSYADDVRRMVTLCRTVPGTYIPPSWLTTEEAQMFVRDVGVPVIS